MDILAPLTFYHPHWTGLTVVARRLAEGLVARGHRVTVLTSRHDRSLPAREVIGGVDVVRLPSLARVSRTAVMPSFPLELTRLMARHDAVHLHTPMPEAAFVVAVARLLGKASLITHHGDVVMPAGRLNRVIKKAMDTTIGGGMRLADRVVVHTEDYHRHSSFLSPFVAKIETLYPPVTTPQPRADVVGAWRSELGLEQAKVVGFAGRFVEEKGFDFLLQAVSLVKAHTPNAHFVFAGDTDVAYERFFERCRPLLEVHRSSITLLGLIRDPQQMADFYGLCDVFVLPSRSDCFAIVQVEAAMCGTPLVTADIPGARQVVKLTGAGLLVAPGDPPALADGIGEILSSPDRYRPRPGSVEAIFDPEGALDGYEELLRRLVDGRGRRTGRRPPQAPA